MTKADKQHFADMLQGLATSTKGGEVTSGVLKVYWLCLQDIPTKDFDRGIERAAHACTWFPSVNELREFAGHKVRGPQPLYLRPVDEELERIETCSYHTAEGAKRPAPNYIPWCRKCRRLKALAERGAGDLGDMLQLMGVAGGKK